MGDRLATIDMGPKSGERLLIVVFLANVNVSSRSLYAVARPSVVCLSVVGNARAPY